MADGNRDETDAPATVDLGPGGGARDPAAPAAPRSAFDRDGARFERTGELGRGGMGRVDDAFDRALGRPVAIKHMLAAGDVDLARFEREAKITARLEHPGIVPIHDTGRGPDGTPYYVMRRIDGRPLAELVVEKQQLAARLALIPHVLTACEAAAYAHARSIVHRDIKPTNILIGPFGESLLIDWGLAREIGETRVDAPLPPSDPQLTRAGTVAGTPGFMAPEQARGEHVDARADVFALGATLFYVLAGKPPYGSDSATEMIGLAGAGRPPDWRALPPQVPPDLRAIVQKAMASDAAARYGDAGALAADLRQFLVGNLVGAYRYGTLARLARFARRHRAAVAVAVVSALALAAVATVSVRRIVAERDDANAARAVAEAQKREAVEAADRLVLQRAQEQLDADPTFAIQLLRQLPADSVLWPQAASVAQAAALLGVPFGFRGSTTDAIAMAPDGRHAAAIDVMRGDLAVVDLLDRTRRSLGRIDGGHSVVWLDAGRHVGVTTPTELVELDLETGATRRRPMPGEQHGLVVDRDGAIWLEANERIYRAASFDAPYEIVRAEPMDLGEDAAMSSVQGKPHVVYRGRDWPLTIAFDKLALLAVRGGVIAISRAHLAAWHWHGDELVPLGSWDVDGPLYGELVGDAVYAATYRGLVRLDAGGVHGLTRAMCAYPARAADVERAAYACNDGSILVVEPAGTWTIAPRRIGYSMIQLGPDGRFLVARTQTGALLAWDLTAFAPQLRELGLHEQMMTAAGNGLWAMSGASDVVGYDLTTWAAHTLRSNHLAMLSEIYTDARGKLLVLEMLVAGRTAGPPISVLRALDPATGATLAELGKDDVLQVGDDGVYVGRHDGAIVRWTNDGGFEARVLLALDAPISNVAERHGVVAAVIHGRELVRVDLATRATARTQVPRDIEALAVGPDGRVWASNDHTVWSWDGRGDPSAFEIADKVDSVYASRSHVVVGTASSIVLPELVPPRTVSLGTNARFTGSPESDWLAAQAGTGVALLDTSSGRVIRLPLDTTPQAIRLTSGGVVIATDGLTPGKQLVRQYSFSVPSEPAEMQRWLAHVTNARAVPGSEATVWP